MQRNRALVLCLVAYKTLYHGIKAALDGLGVTLEGRLTPPIVIMLIGYLDKQPSRQDAKVLY